MGNVMWGGGGRRLIKAPHRTERGPHRTAPYKGAAQDGAGAAQNGAGRTGRRLIKAPHRTERAPHSGQAGQAGARYRELSVAAEEVAGVDLVLDVDEGSVVAVGDDGL